MHQAIQKLREKIKGFTLIELLVVIAIIGILSSTAIVSTNTARKKARDARRLSDMHQIANAMELYLDGNGRMYPDSLEALVPAYIAVLPKDPLNSSNYPYCSNGTAEGVNDGTTFHLGAAMEQHNPSFFDNDADWEEDTCENLADNPSFNGYSEACAGTQKCNGENCDGCLDFTNTVTPGGNGGNGNGGNGDNGGDNSNNNCPDISITQNNNPNWDLDVYIYPHNNGVARVSWTPPNGVGTLYNTYTIKMTGEFYNWSNPPHWETIENRIDSSVENNFFELHNLKPGTNYSVFVETRLWNQLVESSNRTLFTATTNCGNGVCDAEETCSGCTIDCQNN